MALEGVVDEGDERLTGWAFADFVFLALFHLSVSVAKGLQLTGKCDV